MRERIGLVKYGWKLFIVFLLFASTFCYAMFQGGFVSWFLFYSFLPFVLYAFMLAFYPLKNMTAERRLSRGQYKAGDQLEAFVVLKRKWPFPIMFMIVEDCLPDSLGRNGRSAEAKQFLFPWFKKEIKMTYTINSVPRGDHRLAKSGSAQVIRSDCWKENARFNWKTPFSFCLPIKRLLSAPAEALMMNMQAAFQSFAERTAHWHQVSGNTSRATGLHGSTGRRQHGAAS